MVPVSSFAGRVVAVLGLGLSGSAAARALIAGGAKVLAFDDDAGHRAAAEAEGIAIVDLKAADWSTIEALVLSPGVPLTHPEPHWSVRLARKAKVKVIGDTELFERERTARAPKSRLIAITGTNGKSTTAGLVAHIIKTAGRSVWLGGNIGVPVLAFDDVDDAAVYVIEYSSYQIDLTPSLAPDVGVLLNLAEDHLDRHGTFSNYAAIKARLVEAAAHAGVAIVGTDDAECRAIADGIEKRGGRLLRISNHDAVARGVFAHDGRLYQSVGDSVQEIADISRIGSLRGAHNWQNAAAAFAAARVVGIGADQIVRALCSFPGLAHRMEEIGCLGAVLFVNDSKATNADAAARALDSFDTVYWIAGGRAKSGGISSLGQYFPKIVHAYLIGEAAETFAKTLAGKVAFTISGDLESAVRQAAADAAQGRAKQPVVLLAPACASFDQFPNFEVRGEAFRKAVGQLGGVTRKEGLKVC
jgi:UDP-N-acetylmuramoylalanine--D-glutamate ligase